MPSIPETPAGEALLSLLAANTRRGLAAQTGEQMTDRPDGAVTATTHPGQAQLEPEAIGAAQDTVIGMANSAPTVSVGLTVATLAATAAG
jgi:hypothetical protein